MLTAARLVEVVFGDVRTEDAAADLRLAKSIHEGGTIRGIDSKHAGLEFGDLDVLASDSLHLRQRKVDQYDRADGDDR